MLDPIEIAVSALVLAVAAFTIAAIGFGFGLTTTPVMLLYLDPQTVVVVVNAVAILAFGLMLFETRREIRYRELTPVAIAGFLGAPVGVYALSQLNPHALRIGIAVLVLAPHGSRDHEHKVACPEAAGDRGLSSASAPPHW